MQQVGGVVVISCDKSPDFLVAKETRMIQTSQGVSRGEQVQLGVASCRWRMKLAHL